MPSVKIEEVTPPVFEPGVIHSWGYRTTEASVLKQTAWQRDHFGEATRSGNPGSGVWVIRILSISTPEIPRKSWRILTTSRD